MSRNVVLVTIDSLRADHCGFAPGGRSGLTPAMDALAEDGVVFENAVSPGPRTPSSMPESFTGEPMRSVVGDGTDGDYWQHQRAQIRTHMHRHRSVAERLRDRGYTTVGVTTNPWTQDTAFDSGFDRFVTVNSDTLGSYGSQVFRRADRLLRGNRLGDRLSWDNKREWFIRWTDFYDAVKAELEDAPSPFFLWVFLLDTHQPYVTPGEFREESSTFGMYYSSFSELAREGDVPAHVDRGLRRAYRDSVRSADAFLERLRRDAAEADPILVFHADHGEAFGEHGTYGHERQLYRENLRVPFVVSNAGRRGRLDEPVSLRRLPDIVTALADDEAVGLTRFTAPFVFSATENGESSAITGRNWKYIRSDDGAALYHLASDPVERTNAASRYPSVASAFERLRERHRSDRRERAAIGDAAHTTSVERASQDGRMTEWGVAADE